ncbi:hypothetical protein [Streptomyces sp. CBMA156]|uniref:hypothetical protein n=1 Tax=Streptomyces sp. CBMA156 TaxID=1930280 RepID=UPI001661C8E7|nr:hypothetical protein [Streptomyces sp. CBMA156]MBD0669331.1 hypothetical protein [Streptomyces sp. CBMA156]
MLPLPDGGRMPDHLPDQLGGEPSYPSGQARVPAPWRFLFALSDTPDEDDPYFLNFGYGGGFGFLSPDGLEGRFFREAS